MADRINIDWSVIRVARKNLSALARRFPDRVHPPEDDTAMRREMKAWEELLGDIERQAFSVAEAAELIGVHRETIRRAVRAGELKHARIKRRIIISRADLEEWYRALGGGSLFGDDADQ